MSLMSAIWIIIKFLAGCIGVVLLAGILILLLQGFIDAIFRD